MSSNSLDQFMTMSNNHMETFGQQGDGFNSEYQGTPVNASNEAFIMDRFYIKERDLVLRGVDYLVTFLRSCTKDWAKQMDHWTTRPNGSLFVGSQNKVFMKRLMMGADLKNQAAQSITSAQGFLHYLNITQLIQIWSIQMNFNDWSKSANKLISTFAMRCEECIADKLVCWLANRPLDVENNVDPEVYFTSDARRFLGHKALIILGSMTDALKDQREVNFKRDMSMWFIMLSNEHHSASEGNTDDEPPGIFIQYPTLYTSIKRPSSEQIVYSLVTSVTKTKLTHNQNTYFNIVRSADSPSLKEFAKVLENFKDIKFEKNGINIAGTKAAIGDAATADDNESSLATDVVLDSCSSSSSRLEIDINQVSFDEEEHAEFTRLKETLDLEEPEPVAPIDTQEGFYGEDGYFYYLDESTGEYYTYGEEEPGTEQQEEYNFYFDPYYECYMYYGYQVQYDPDGEAYYIYNEEDENYYYLDDESAKMLEDGEVPTWDYDMDASNTEVPEGYYLAEDGYYYPNEEEGGEQEEPVVEEAMEPEVAVPEVAVEVVAAPVVAVTPEPEPETAPVADAKAVDTAEVETAPSTPGPDNGIQAAKLAISAKLPLNLRASRRRAHINSLEQVKASEQMLYQRANDVILNELNSYFTKPMVQEKLINHWVARPNGELRVGKNKRIIVGLMTGEIELKALPNISLSDISGCLKDLNLAQLVQIRHKAQNSAWSKSPVQGMKVFAIKADAMIAEKLLCYCFAKSADKDDGTDARETVIANILANDCEELKKQFKPVELRYMGIHALFMFGAKSIWKDPSNTWSNGSYWYIPSNPTCTLQNSGISDLSGAKGIYLRVPSMSVCLEEPEAKDTIYQFSQGPTNMGYTLWDIIPIREGKTA